MNIKQIITDYIMKSILTTEGDMVVRGVSVPERIAPTEIDQYFKSMSPGAKPVWTRDIGGINTVGDLIIHGLVKPERLAAVAAGQVLKSGGVGAEPAWGVPRIGDMDMAIGNYIQAAAGDEVISGLGFPPRLVFFLANDSTTSNKNFSIAIDNGTILIVLWAYDSLGFIATGEVFSIHIRRNGTNFITGAISALGGDGFTVTHALTGACSATVRWFAIG